jgi:hypothetical protein
LDKDISACSESGPWQSSFPAGFDIGRAISNGICSVCNMLSVLFGCQHRFDLHSSDTTPANLDIRTLDS